VWKGQIMVLFIVRDVHIHGSSSDGGGEWNL
jgi:hypothetical protein